jgi:LmbE family N-acetylglucosaminyl deacetylase
MLRVELLRRVYRRCVRPDARNALAVSLLLVQHDRWPKTIERWDECRVAVLAPHPDDEAIGCAGAVLSHVAAGAQVEVWHVSDGRHGDRRLQDPSLSTQQRAVLQRDLIATRRTEATQWAAGAGVAAVRFLDAEDGRISPDDAVAVDRLAASLEALRPELVYLPFVTDLLEDHWQTSRLLVAAISQCRGEWVKALVLRGYEVWSPLPANRVADITALAPRKRELLDLYTSQLRDVDYRRAVEGLNTYRSMMLAGTGIGQAEGFFECHLRGWLDIVQRAARPPAPVSDHAADHVAEHVASRTDVRATTIATTRPPTSTSAGITA